MRRRNQVFSTIMAFALAMNLFTIPVCAVGSGESENDGVTYSDTENDTSTQDKENDDTNEEQDDGVANAYVKDGRDDADSGDKVLDNEISDDDINVEPEITEDVEKDEIEKNEYGIMSISDEGEEYTYVMMNIPYKVLYSNENLADDVPDVISTATTAKFTQTKELAKGTYNDGTYIRGVVYPVKLSTDDYEIAEGLENDYGDYAIVGTASNPTAYLELSDITDGNLSGTLQSPDQDSSAISVTNFTTNSNYGNYQFEISGIDTSSTTIYGIILTTADGNNYPLYMLNNLWLGGGVKIAWSVVGEPDVLMKDKKTVHYKYSMENKTLSNVKLITSTGTYNIECNEIMKPHYTDDVTATTPSVYNIKVSGLPEDIENAKATVYYTTGDKRTGINYFYQAQGNVVNDGVILLDSAMDSEHKYTVDIESDKLADIVINNLELGGELEENIYVMMNIPYKDFYASENINISNDLVDVVSTATTTKFKGTTGLAKGTYNDGTSIRGVVYPVKLSVSDYENAKTLANDNGDYAIVGSASTPTAYMEATIEGGSIKFQLNATEKNVEGLSVANLSTSGSYGNYQVDLVGVKTAGTIGEENVTISGVILTTSDGNNYPLYILDNIWLGTRVENVELAWSVKGAPTIYKSHGSGPATHQYDMNGKTLTNVKLITNVGTYNITSDLALTPYYEGEVTAKTTSNKTIEVSGLPDNIDNANVSVYYTTGSGRQIQTHYLVKDAIIDNGIVTLDTAMEDGQTYTVYITSGNYAQITVDVALNIPKPLPPYYDDNDNNSNDEDSSTSSETAPTTTIEPSYTTSSGIVVTGWKNVIEGVVKDSDLYQYGSVGDVSAVTSRKTLNINLKNTTNLVIPTEVVSTMKQSGADYNFYYKNTAITISQEKLANQAGSIDLNIEIENKKFNDDFDSFSLKVNKATSSLEGSIVNAVLSTDKAGKGAYIFKKSGNNVYESAGAAFISEIGTVTLSIDNTDDILILY